MRATPAKHGGVALTLVAAASSVDDHVDILIQQITLDNAQSHGRSG
jgi:hypothetical protein